MSVILIVMAALQGLTLWKVLTMSKNTDAADRLETSAARLEATIEQGTILIDKLAALPAADDVSDRINAVADAMDKANDSLGLVVTGNQPAA